MDLLLLWGHQFARFAGEFASRTVGRVHSSRRTVATKGVSTAMDQSKLPRMSQTPAPPPAVEEDPNPPLAQTPVAGTQRVPGAPVDYGVDPGGFGGLAEAWISIAIGAILLLLFFRPIEYLFSSKQSFDQKYVFTAADGSPLAYTQTVFFFGDVAIVAFALVLIFDGLILFTRKPRLIAAALVFTVIATLLNIGYVLRMMSGGYGLQISSALAVVFGVYIAMVQWKMLQTFRAIQQYQRGVA
jgi:hypothetical protein